MQGELGGGEESAQIEKAACIKAQSLSGSWGT